MKTIIFSLIIMGFHLDLIAQRPDFSPQCKEAMQQLAALAGDWKGTATMQTQNGPMTLDQSEHIEWKLDGLLLAIEGIGRQKDAIQFHAFAVINFDPFTKQFKFKSFVKEGYATDAYFKVQQENQFEWGFDISSGGKSKHTIVLDREKKTWYESGEYSRDGTTWMKFIELNLTRN